MPLDSITDAYKQIAGFDAPNPMQTAVWNTFTQQHPLGIALFLKGLTGSGKTEAIVIPALAKGRRLIMVYPTRSLVEDQIGRFQKLLQNYSSLPEQRDKPITLTVDTGAQSLRYVWQNGQSVNRKPGDERITRHLHVGNVIITTLDKFLYRFFGFGEPQKSYIYPLRIHYMKPVICFDEAHSYEETAFVNFERLVNLLYDRGKDIVLMTATMPQAYLARFRNLETVDFTEGENAQRMAEWQNKPHPEKKLYYIPADIMRDEAAPDRPSPAVMRILQETRQHYANNKRIIVTVESVRDAAFIYRHLRDAFSDVFLYHGRLTHQQRQQVYARLKERDENNQNYLLVSTSAIEVGCDLNAHTLITQLCDPDRLIQRAGRCNRKQEISDAALIVIGSDIPTWATSLSDEQRQAYLNALQKQHEQQFNPTAVTPLMAKEIIHDPRIEIMFDMLYEYVYDARLENKKLHDNGLIVTRSWEPSITLCQGEEEGGRLIEPITVPISYCRVPQGEEPVRFLNSGGFFKRTYDKNKHRPVLQSLKSSSRRWENGYRNDIVVCLDGFSYADGSPYDPELGYVDLPFLFHGPFPRGAKRIVEHGVDNDKFTIWYIDPENVTAVLPEWETAVSPNDHEYTTEHTEEEDHAE